MDIGHQVQSTPLVDVAIVISLFAFFVFGVMQGAIRRLIGIISVLVAFLLAANLREPFGNYLADNWRQFSGGMNHLLAFCILFAIFAVAASVVTQGYYKRTDIYAKKPIVDDIVGGALGVLEGVLLLVIAVVIFNSYTIQESYTGEIDYLRQAQDMLIHQSQIAGAVKDHVAPAFVSALAPFLPDAIVRIF